LSLTEYDSVFSQVPPDRVGYVFSHDDENTMFWVLKRRVPAGATDVIKFYELAGVRMDELRILLRSINVPRQVVVHRGDLSPGLVTAIERVLLSMDEDPEGMAILNRLQDKTSLINSRGGGKSI
jgi:phosphonate transport system substrate-binding protein